MESGSSDALESLRKLVSVKEQSMAEDTRRLTAFMLRLCLTLFCQPVPLKSRAFWLCLRTHSYTCLRDSV